MKNSKIRTKLGESNELATSLSSFIDPVNSPLDGFLEVKPSWLSIDCCGLVLL